MTGKPGRGKTGAPSPHGPRTAVVSPPTIPFGRTAPAIRAPRRSPTPPAPAGASAGAADAANGRLTPTPGAQPPAFPPASSPPAAAHGCVAGADAPTPAHSPHDRSTTDGPDCISRPSSADCTRRNGPDRGPVSGAPTWRHSKNTPMSWPKRRPETGEEETKKIEVADFSREVGKVNGEVEAPAQPWAPEWPLMRQLNG